MEFKSFLPLVLILCSAFAVNAQENPRDQGIVLYLQSNFEKAAELLQAAVELDKKDGTAWRYLGASYVHLGKRKEATKAFSKESISKESLPKYDKPLKITSKRPASFTEEARRNLISGTIKIAVEFRGDGAVGFVFPFQTLPYGLTENAVAAAKRIKFEPAIHNDTPVTVVSVIEYGFSIY